MALYDSDVIIWYTRGYRPAGELLNADTAVSLSVVTLLETYQGARNARDLLYLRGEIPKLVKTIYPLTPAISARALEICAAYNLQVALSVADCLIAATALEHGVTLVTDNLKHFSVIRDLRLQTFKV